MLVRVRLFWRKGGRARPSLLKVTHSKPFNPLANTSCLLLQLWCLNYATRKYAYTRIPTCATVSAYTYAYPETVQCRCEAFQSMIFKSNKAALDPSTTRTRILTGAADRRQAINLVLNSGISRSNDLVYGRPTRLPTSAEKSGKRIAIPGHVSHGSLAT